MSGFEDVRDADGKLLFRIDRERALIEIQRRRKKQIIDLSCFGLNKQPLDKVNLDTVK